jgi:hypothetical protein
LDRGTRNDEGVAAGLDEKVGIDEIARPQRLILVAKERLQADGGGGLVDHVVDQQELAGREREAIVLVEGGHLDRTALQGLAHVGERGRRQRE